MFQEGPKSGPPPGGGYAAVGYGLFEPFVLKQLTPADRAPTVEAGGAEVKKP